MHNKPASRVNVMEISGALGNCPLFFALANFLAVGGSVLELLSTSDITYGEDSALKLLDYSKHNLNRSSGVIQNV